MYILNFNSLIFLQQRVPIRSEVSWNPDFSLVAIGNDDGWEIELLFLGNTGDPLVAYYEVLCSVPWFMRNKVWTQNWEKCHSFSV